MNEAPATQRASPKKTKSAIRPSRLVKRNAEVVSASKDSAAARAPQSGDAKPHTKANSIVALLVRPQGASIKELCDATGWKAHSVRGFISGTLKRKDKRVVRSVKDAESGVRRYSMEAGNGEPRRP